MAAVPAFAAGVKFIELSGKGLEAAAAAIQDVQIVPMEGPSRFVKPQSVNFMHEGRRRRWDMVASHPSVSVILFHKELEALLLVRQFRPAVYAAAVFAAGGALEIGTPTPSEESSARPPVPISAGFTYELCAGIVDKAGKDLAEIAKEEVLEEVGYEVPGAALQPVACALTAVGISGALQTFFYTEVDESQRVSAGGGNPEEAEAIDVVGLPVSQLDKFVADSTLAKPPGVLFAAMWLKNRLCH